MERIPIEIDSNNDQELIEAINGLHQITLGDDTIECQVCNEAIIPGNKVVCYLLCSGTTGYDLTQFRCTEHSDNVTDLLTLGTDELIIDGRVGRCSDQVTQQSWPVLLAPQLRLVSSASTTTAREIKAHPDNHDDPFDPLSIDTPNSTNSHSGGGSVTTEESSERQETTLGRWAQSSTEVTEDDY